MASPPYAFSNHYVSPPGSDAHLVASSSPALPGTHIPPPDAGLQPQPNANNFGGVYPAPGPARGAYSQGPVTMYPNPPMVCFFILVRLFLLISTSVRLPTLPLIKRPRTTTSRLVT
jgi:hypothetical protein